MAVTRVSFNRGHYAAVAALGQRSASAHTHQLCVADNAGAALRSLRASWTVWQRDPSYTGILEKDNSLFFVFFPVHFTVCLGLWYEFMTAS